MEEAYNGFGYNFENPIIKKIKDFLKEDAQPGELIADIGCGNSLYRDLLPPTCHYFAMYLVDDSDKNAKP